MHNKNTKNYRCKYIQNSILEKLSRNIARHTTDIYNKKGITKYYKNNYYPQRSLLFF